MGLVYSLEGWGEGELREREERRKGEKEEEGKTTEKERSIGRRREEEGKTNPQSSKIRRRSFRGKRRRPSDSMVISGKRRHKKLSSERILNKKQCKTSY